nr:poly(A) polymerase [Hymenolepis microstoma]
MTKPPNPSEIPPQCLGETGALSLKPPTDEEKQDSLALEDTLLKMDIFEDEHEMYQRRLALARLQKISNNWIYKKALEQKIPSHNARNTQGKVFTFGSYRLGVNFKAADIDALLVVPRFITREDFFGDFQNVLLEDDSVEDLAAVPDAFVPVLKMKLLGVEIDLLFAQVDLMTIRDDFSLSDNTEQLLRNMDERDVRSVNGVRVTNDILDLVYQKEVFKKSLKVIRLWAKRKNIYSNACGFLGGVSWAIMVCRICQLYPMAYPSLIVYTFFRIYKDWPWPKPVRLRESEHISSLGLPVWDPRHNPSDQLHLMPILTPSYPSQNSTYNVQRSNKLVIEREFKEAFDITRDIVLKKRHWSDLFKPSFFFTYRHYLCVIVSGNEKRPFKERCGLVESRLRVLVSNLESIRYVQLAHVNSRSYGRGPRDEEAEFIKKWFIGIVFCDDPGQSATSVNHLATNHTNNNNNNSTDSQSSDHHRVNVDLTKEVRSFEHALERGTSSELTPNVVVTIKHLKRQNLVDVLPPEEMAIVRKHKKAMAVKKATKKITETPSPCSQSPQNDNHSNNSSQAQNSPNNVLSTVTDEKPKPSTSAKDCSAADFPNENTAGQPNGIKRSSSPNDSDSPKRAKQMSPHSIDAPVTETASGKFSLSQCARYEQPKVVSIEASLPLFLIFRYSLLPASSTIMFPFPTTIITSHLYKKCNAFYYFY